jgi:hypothetical protein
VPPTAEPLATPQPHKVQPWRAAETKELAKWYALWNLTLWGAPVNAATAAASVVLPFPLTVGVLAANTALAGLYMLGCGLVTDWHTCGSLVRHWMGATGNTWHWDVARLIAKDRDIQNGCTSQLQCAVWFIEREIAAGRLSCSGKGSSTADIIGCYCGTKSGIGQPYDWALGTHYHFGRGRVALRCVGDMVSEVRLDFDYSVEDTFTLAKTPAGEEYFRTWVYTVHPGTRRPLGRDYYTRGETRIPLVWKPGRGQELACWPPSKRTAR